jgi:hypothetical protein
MQYYNAKDKFIMKRAGADIFGHSHGGATEWAYEPLGGASRRVVCVVVVVEEVNALL